HRLADYFDFAFLDTGALYRAVALTLLRQGGSADDEAGAIAAARDFAAKVALDLLDDPDLRSEPVSQAASKVSAIGEVRRILFDFQRNFTQTPPNNAPGAVLDGRDIGTVICPEADVKLFLKASPEVRAERRRMELLTRGIESDYETVLTEMKQRDARDLTRAAAPLKAAPDAFILDTSCLSIEEVFRAALEKVMAHMATGY
ncbi:MAG: (d)CMP kinase, partial [Pseudomonadota bacterium]|nr:(d)CMP kinase [Pseudomonadota bacterium]